MALFKKIIILFLISIIAPQAYSAGNKCAGIFAQVQTESTVLTSSFERSFHNGYQPGRCSENTTHFITSLARDNSDIDLSGFEVLLITTPLFTHFENANSFTKAMINIFNPYRNEVLSHKNRRSIVLGRKTDTEIEADRENSSRAWYYHVVLKKDGVIYDFDYKNQPTPVDEANYLDQFTVKTGGLIVPARLLDNPPLLIYSLQITRELLEEYDITHGDVFFELILDGEPKTFL